MVWWRRLGKWEKHLEKAPKIIIVRTLVLVFCLSIVVGAVVSASLNVLSARAVTTLDQEIRKLETQDMEKRMQLLRYARSNVD
ncbi:MAG: hypothetical protein UV61_C0002G0095 [Candidatus Gottesmanbacteria bacterium GW2011_GWB1_43_11]|uniref:Uncharacterized protein n=1 Tax=Candidatus Gottesmanbacteria bacterium GW2011_GWB1_43_11 TaxID=1618446 RepID=A0A0G1CP95_9BACT|nr:MAG: hypothetical protein UV04_C0028G0008 [Candidatus Gottesmanbacteria bacterium GW2011_GWA2_42_16]KKS52349.1 MAG: hypothetical protein UV17_C0046G0007 [Candidatus Gottesmanbacteria bacterium GW2011_GWA1_42_26]KKS81820.1 MAG: hypothetical protein UV55_C0008G0035 [Candidatus Gottesmanbacteria bacterium GW2011_GWC1_43_10]KKS87374.1 MAG: hypothetical protein UV61_C0002G0095 [Candidatus Gottesmanbacteria bacterium GW2011_GWB1_43_11]OGG10539.1 MAG: hypothetical protein A2699_01985 [Candidatus Go